MKRPLVRREVIGFGIGIGIILGIVTHTLQVEKVEEHIIPTAHAEEPHKVVLIETVDSRTIEEQVKDTFKDTPVLIEIARCESSYRQFNEDGTILKGKIDKDDTGIMQINKRYHLKQSKELGMDIDTVKGNIAYGHWLFKQQGTQPWNASKKCWSK